MYEIQNRRYIGSEIGDCDISNNRLNKVKVYE